MIGLIEICHQSWIQRKIESILFAFYIDWIHTYVCCWKVDWFLRMFFFRNEERLRRLEEKNYVSANFIATEQEPHQYSSLQDISGPSRPLSSEWEGIEIHQSWSRPHRSLKIEAAQRLQPVSPIRTVKSFYFPFKKQNNNYKHLV